jgi:hypothetical protein
MKIARNKLSQSKFHHGTHPDQERHCHVSDCSKETVDESGQDTQNVIEGNVEFNEVDAQTIKERAVKIVSFLPKENCGKCGFPNCGSFAMSVAKMEASPFGCHKDPSAGFKASEMLGIEVSQSEREKVLAHRPGHHGDSRGGMHGHPHHGHGQHHHHRD